MYGRILVPLDGSTFGERVLPCLLPLLAGQSGSVLLLRVVSGARAWVEDDPSYSASNPAQEAHRYLRGIQGELHGLGIQASFRVVTGDAASSICEIARQEKVGLIAMTTHGWAGMSRWPLGSVADHVVRVACSPVLLVGPATTCQPHAPLPRILVPLDGSTLAESALPPALGLAVQWRGSLLLLRAVEMRTERELDGIVQQVDGAGVIRAQRARAADAYLGYVGQCLEEVGVASERLVAHHPAARAILGAAEAQRTDLIVMTTHARSGLGRWVYGSVGASVLRAAPCPLLLVRAESSMPLTLGLSTAHAPSRAGLPQDN